MLLVAALSVCLFLGVPSTEGIGLLYGGYDAVHAITSPAPSLGVPSYTVAPFLYGAGGPVAAPPVISHQGIPLELQNIGVGVHQYLPVVQHLPQFVHHTYVSPDFSGPLLSTFVSHAGFPEAKTVVSTSAVSDESTLNSVLLKRLAENDAKNDQITAAANLAAEKAANDVSKFFLKLLGYNQRSAINSPLTSPLVLAQRTVPFLSGSGLTVDDLIAAKAESERAAKLAQAKTAATNAINLAANNLAAENAANIAAGRLYVI